MVPEDQGPQEALKFHSVHLLLQALLHQVPQPSLGSRLFLEDPGAQVVLVVQGDLKPPQIRPFPQPLLAAPVALEVLGVQVHQRILEHHLLLQVQGCLVCQSHPLGLALLVALCLLLDQQDPLDLVASCLCFPYFPATLALLRNLGFPFRPLHPVGPLVLEAPLPSECSPCLCSS